MASLSFQKGTVRLELTITKIDVIMDYVCIYKLFVVAKHQKGLLAAFIWHEQTKGSLEM